MAGLPAYRCSSELADCWWIPLEQIGCKVERFPNRGVIRRANAKIGIGFEGDGFILVFSALLSRGKNARLAQEVERILLASGAEVHGKLLSTNLIYYVSEEPRREWLERVQPDGAEIHREPETTTKGQYACGSIKAGATSIRFWTGPAINPESKTLTHYLALGTDAFSVSGDPFLQSLDSALTAHGAIRLETQRKLDK